MRLRLILGCLVLFAAAPAFAAGDVEAGKKVFTKCSVCHAPVEGQNKLGPSLWGVVGRHSASLPNYNYSAAMKAANKTWDEASLDEYLTAPQKVVKGTKMAFPGLSSADDRANVIAYLATLK